MMHRLTEGQLAVFRRHMRQRDEAAMKIGISTYTWRRQVEAEERVIQQSQREEAEYRAEVLKALGLDPQRGYRVDLDTGEVVGG